MPLTQAGAAPRDNLPSGLEPALQRRLPLYAYLEPLLAGKRVLEIGRPGPAGTELLASLAARVVTVEADPSAISAAAAGAERFDVVLVPEGEATLGRPGAMAGWRRALADGGRLIVAVTSADRPGATGGVGYYELHDAFATHFSRVQMLGLTPFLGMGVVEFDGAVDGLRIDARLVKGGAETPAAYVAIGGAALATGLGYALVQLPYAAAAPARGDTGGRPERVDDDVTERRYRGRVEEAEARVAELRRKLEDASTESEAAMRVARAQGDEIEELRGRLRRAAEDRSALDAEMAKLRRALADADESVLSLTRRTAEEMAAVAERMAMGLRAPVAGASAELTAARDEAARLRVKLAETETRAAAAEQRLEEIGAATRERQVGLEDALERLRLSESELARSRRDMIRLEQTARAQAEGSGRAVDTAPLERALAARDERIARLEAEKQELVWRIAELEDKLRAAIARALRAESGAPAAAHAATAVTHAPEDSAAAQGSRERVIEEYHRAAAAHVQEITELKAALAEQAALVAELEDGLRAAEGRGNAAETEATTLRRTAKDLADADRSRRSRLAELEGKLLRLEHERRQAVANAAAAQPPPVQTGADPEELARVRAARDELVRRGEEDRVAWTREREALRAEVAALNARVANGHHAPPNEPAHEPAPAVNEASDAGRLESTLGNYRQRAGRLRDDLEGIRRRLDSLTSSEIAGFLEELGDDLAELEK